MALALYVLIARIRLSFAMHDSVYCGWGNVVFVRQSLHGRTFFRCRGIAAVDVHHLLIRELCPRTHRLSCRTCRAELRGSAAGKQVRVAPLVPALAWILSARSKCLFRFLFRGQDLERARVGISRNLVFCQ